jgi:hypothetical protein
LVPEDGELILFNSRRVHAVEPPWVGRESLGLASSAFPLIASR